MKRSTWIFKYAIIALGILSCSDSSDGEETPVDMGGKEEEMEVQPEEGTVRVILTTADGNTRLRELDNKLPFTNTPASGATITLNEAVTLQTIEGFGGALTGSAAALLQNNTQALNALFGAEGARLSYTRLTVGASDFNKNGSYTYNDIVEAEDINLENFSISEDFTSNNPVVPVAKSIITINPNMGFLASPWTAPAWMKGNRSFNGGSLLPRYYSSYANYLVKYLEAYNAEGVGINTITVQNEPLFETNAYPTMKMSALEQAAFIGMHFGPALEATNLSTEIIGYDHNFREAEDPDFPITLLSNTEAAKYTNAIAYHAYAGVPGEINRVKTQFPNADIYFTEQSGIQNGGTTFGGEIDFFMKTIFMGTLRRGAKTILLWNLALDANGGPTNGGCQDCRGILTVSSNGSFVKNVDYYILAHFSKYVDKGATVIASNNLQGSLENVAFKNPDGSKVLVVYNASNAAAPQNFNVSLGGARFSYALPKGAVVTFKWD